MWHLHSPLYDHHPQSSLLRGLSVFAFLSYRLRVSSSRFWSPGVWWAGSRYEWDICSSETEQDLISSSAFCNMPPLPLLCISFRIWNILETHKLHGIRGRVCLLHHSTHGTRHTDWTQADTILLERLVLSPSSRAYLCKCVPLRQWLSLLALVWPFVRWLWS